MSAETTPLSLEQAPPISVPLRFLLTAPLFGILAALAMFWAGPDPWINRWSPSIVAITHLLTLGVITQAMAGSLLQMLPVVAGSPVPRPRLLSLLVYVPFNIGALALPAGFLWHEPLLTQIAVVALLFALAALLLGIALSLARAPVGHPAIRAMGLSAVALLVTCLLGVGLGAFFAWGQWPELYPLLTDLHPAWGLLGWVGLLIAGVAYQVVPMFQITPTYPALLTRWLAPVLFTALLVWSAGQLLSDNPLLIWAGVIVVVICYLAFAGTTLRLQALRRRKLPDVTLNFWRVAMSCLILAALLWPAGYLCPVPEIAQSLEVLIGMVFIAGFVLGVINGMLYKIVPFLVWLHLQMLPAARGLVPNMKQVIPPVQANRQFRLYVAALGLLIGTAIYPHLFVYPAALALGGSFVLLGWNLLSAWRVYQGVLKTLAHTGSTTTTNQ